MRSALDVPADGFNDHEKKLVTKIRELGWFHTSVFAEDDSVGFSYTTGFWLSLGYPELIVFSIDGDAAHEILWNAYRRVEAGRLFPIGEPISGIFEGFDALLLPVEKHHYREYLLSTRWFYGGEDFPCLQLIWPDDRGLFPWQPGANENFANDQPDLSPDGWAAQRA
jgi:hypothetical protein